eukprot:TRINITY_DN887_c1_g3_i2.p1 TRINITY_DN887_c1_g3~~TRINITY_DN887_c1_g3_i2.p1  ORF type:complete len:429 (+),score=125.02 TRINITY_DN887_c1_g3_i2:87-1373(+)
MKLNRPPTVQLSVCLPSSRESFAVEVEAGEDMQAVKERIGSVIKLLKGTFLLTFEEEEVGGEDDTRLVGDLPFEDQSTLRVVYNKKHEAMMKLAEMNCTDGIRGLHKELRKIRLLRDDNTYCVLIEALKDAGLLEDKRKASELLHLTAVHDTCLSQSVGLLLVANVEWNLRTLHTAVCLGHTAVVNVFLQHGADVNAMDEKGRTSLHHAVGAGKKDVASLLLENEADVHAKDRKGCTPLLYMFTMDTRRARTDLTSFLLQHGADIHATDNRGRTPLHLLMSCRDLELISFLLEQGVDVNAADEKGNTALHAAIEDKTAGQITRLLLENWPPTRDGINIKNARGLTPLHLASCCDIETVQLLLRHGADLHMEDVKGQTPLQYAAVERSGLKDLAAVFSDAGGRRSTASSSIDGGKKKKNGKETVVHLAT